jgi:phosphopantetheinyl transferase
MRDLLASTAQVLARTRPVDERSPPHDGALAGLGADERARARAIGDPRARARFVAGRQLLRDTLAELRPPLRHVDDLFDIDRTGRVHVGGHPDLAVSISHTRGLVAVAVATDGPVGIDVEPTGRGELPPPAAWLGERERRWAAACPEALRRAWLLQRWVAKEAVLKLGGPAGTVTRRGIEVHAQTGETARVSRTLQGDILAVVRWQVVPAGYLVALARAPVAGARWQAGDEPPSAIGS